MLRSLRRAHALGLALVLSGCGARSELPFPTAPDCFGDGLVPSAPSCVAPAPVPTMFYVDPTAEIGLLAVDADAVYFTDVAAAQVVRVPKCGGPAVPVAGPHAYDMGTALSLAVACANVAWIDALDTGGDIVAGPSAPGDQARLLASIVKPLSSSIGVDVDYVYYGSVPLEDIGWLTRYGTVPTCLQCVRIDAQPVRCPKSSTKTRRRSACDRGLRRAVRGHGGGPSDLAHMGPRKHPAPSRRHARRPRPAPTRVWLTRQTAPR